MARNKLVRRALLVVAILVVAVTGLFLLARAMFPAEKLRRLAVEKLEQATGLDIAVEDAQISFVHWRLGVKVSGVDISRPQDGTKLASIPRLGAALAVIPLFRRQIVVSELYVDRPRVEIVAGQRTETVTPASRRPAAGAAPALSFQIPKAVVRDAEIVFRDPKNGNELRVERLNITSRAKAARGFETVSTDGRFSARRISFVSLIKDRQLFPAQSVTGTWEATVKPREELLEIQNVSVSVADVPIEVTGRVTLADPPGSAEIQRSGVAQSRQGPELDLRIVMKEVALEKLVSLAPEQAASKIPDVAQLGTLNVVSLVKGRLPFPLVDTRFDLATGGVAKLAGRAEVSTQEPREVAFESSGRVKLEEVQKLLSMGKGPKARKGDVSFDVRGSAPLEEVKKDPFSIQAWGQVSCSRIHIEMEEPGLTTEVENLRVDLSGRRAEVSQTIINVASSTFNVAGSVQDWRKRNFQLKVSSPRLNLKELMIPASKPGGRAEKKTPAMPPLPFAALGMQSTTSVRVDRLTFGNFEARDLSATVLMGGDSVSVTEVAMQALGGHAGGKALLRVPEKGEPSYTASFTAGDVQLGALLDQFTPLKGLMRGATSFRIAFDGKLGEDPLPIKSITAIGDVKSSKVAAIATPLVTALATWVGMENKKEYAINDFATSFSVRDGRLIVPACSLVEKNSTWKFSGSTGMDGSLDQKVNVILSPEYSKRVNSLKGLGQLLKDDHGRVVVDLFLGGTVKKPALRWDSARMEQRAKDYLAGRLKGELEKQVKKGLDMKPEERKKLEQTADSLRKEAETTGKKLLEGLLKKKK